MTNDKKSIPENIDDYLQQILSRYESRAKSFENSFKILLLFSVLFLFVIQIPFISIQVKKENINNEIKKILFTKELNSRAVLTFQNAQNGIEELRQAIRRSPERLRDFIIGGINQNQMQNAQQQSNARLFSREEQQMAMETVDRDDLALLVKNEVEHHFIEYKEILEKKIIEPLDSLGENNLKSFIFDLDTLETIFKARYDENPEFWTTFAGKQDFYHEFDQKVGQFLTQFATSLNEQKFKLDGELKRVSLEIDSLSAIAVQQKEVEKQISARMEQIEFPFGKVPVGLSESIAVFPLLITIGLILSISLFVETIKLRKNLHNLYVIKDPRREVLTDMQISLIAPLWIDPLQSRKNQKTKTLLLAMPFLIFLISVGIIIYTWLLPNQAVVATSDTWWIYVFLYLLCFIISLLNFKKMFNELSNYKNYTD